MSAILTFLTGSAFRALFGEISTYFSKRQEHAQELDRMRLQSALAAAAHAQQLEAIKAQGALEVTRINVSSDAAVSQTEASAFATAMAQINKTVGIKWVDGWNAAIRPAFATVALGLWILALRRAGWILTEWDLSMIGAVSGYFFADRHMGKRGK